MTMTRLSRKKHNLGKDQVVHANEKVDHYHNDLVAKRREVNHNQSHSGNYVHTDDRNKEESHTNHHDSQPQSAKDKDDQGGPDHRDNKAGDINNEKDGHEHHLHEQEEHSSKSNDQQLKIQHETMKFIKAQVERGSKQFYNYGDRLKTVEVLEAEYDVTCGMEMVETVPFALKNRGYAEVMDVEHMSIHNVNNGVLPSKLLISLYMLIYVLIYRLGWS